MSEYVMMEEQWNKPGQASQFSAKSFNEIMNDVVSQIEMKLYFNLNRSVAPINIC